MSQLVRTEAPGAPVLTLAEAREHLRVDAWGSPPVSEDDDLIEAYVAAATGELDGVDGWLGRALITQKWRMTLDGFPSGKIRIPLPPLQSIDEIGYIDRDGVDQELDASAYRVVIQADPGYVEPVFNTVWPSARAIDDSVYIDFTCGYGVAGSSVPEIIRNYIRVRTGQAYALREAVIAGSIVAPVPYVRDSLESIRMRGVWP